MGLRKSLKAKKKPQRMIGSFDKLREQWEDEERDVVYNKDDG
jgi:hypothetical protein